ncbi:hypothetical protein AMAG_08341 [Allomyces macrogynus ATCC 38327]|uniref:RNA polymerase I-specific transcription initiation factor RRN3 n=1 Tax=Allomyces macrogynus (strain ATCC 38327) TaxID=578462 RepID=A0A0L0SL78_ALLM3|nr:hypothetical protein AMAG_08341 [Allomyces macrogynus ATCC 38327]|eukprot:KNE63188.1 hypothetical protein AMAG_08341 [Allomyces macrogynus ATCC 38327]
MAHPAHQLSSSGRARATTRPRSGLTTPSQRASPSSSPPHASATSQATLSPAAPAPAPSAPAPSTNVTQLMLVSFVRSAYDKRVRGDGVPLREMAAQLQALAQAAARNADADAQLAMWVGAVAQCAALVPRADRVWIDQLLALPGLRGSSTLADAYRTMLENLASAHANLSERILARLLDMLRFDANNQSATVSMDMYYDRLHATIGSVLAINPAAPQKIVALLDERFPHRRLPIIEQQAYVSNMLRIISYAPVLRQQLLAVIINRLLLIDVEIQVDVDDIESNPMDPQFLFEMDGVVPPHLASDAFNGTDGAESGSESDSSDDDSDHGGAGSDSDEDGQADDDDDDSDAAGPVATLSTEALMTKLDLLMFILFSYLASPTATLHCTHRDLFLDLVHIFDTAILPTYKSRHVQFLLFYLAAREPQFTDMFLGLLARKIVETEHAAMVRYSAALYMASFVARANFLPTSHIVGCYQLLIRYCVAFVGANEQYVTYPDVDKFGVFYAVTQAVLYMFCFRHAELCAALGPKGGLDGFEQVILSKFNPLKVLSPPVVNEFARITHDKHILYCYAIMQRNRRLYIPTRASKSFALDAFFPFDPFKLPQARAYIDPLYVEWKPHQPAVVEPDLMNTDLIEPFPTLLGSSPPPPSAATVSPPGSRHASGRGCARRASDAASVHAGGSSRGTARKRTSTVLSAAGTPVLRAAPMDVPSRPGSEAPSPRAVPADDALLEAEMHAMSISPMAHEGAAVLMHQLGMVRQ